MKPYIGSLILAVCYALIGGACTDDFSTGMPRKDGARLQILLTVPGNPTGSTRAFTPAYENTVDALQLLLFRKSNDGKDVFYDCVNAIPDPGQKGNQAFTATADLPVATGLYSMTALANLAGELVTIGEYDADENIYTQFVGKTKEEVLDMLRFSCGGAWGTDTGSDDTWRPLPMWGDSPGNFALTVGLKGTDIETIHLMRAVAAIDVGLGMNADGEPAGIDNFRLTDVFVYNMPWEGRAAPFTDAAHYNPTGGSEGKGIVLQPSIPEDAAVLNGQLNRYTAADPATGTTGFIRQIYTAEADNKGKAADASEELCCLVIGGLYAGEVTPSYYRIDFTHERQTGADTPPDQAVLANRLDLLRNHRYRVSITSVDGPGYTTPEEAFRSAPVNMQTEVNVWDEGALDDSVLGGKYTLKVSTNQFNLFVDGYSKPLTITTDHPDGWEIEAPEGGIPAWLKRAVIDEVTGNEVRHALTDGWSRADNGSDRLRIGAETATWLRETYFYVRAGNLRKKIHVKQTLERGLELEVDPGQLWFAASSRRALPVNITTVPARQAVYFTVYSDDTELNNPANWVHTEGGATVKGFPDSGQPCTGTVYFRPPVNKTGKVRHALLTVYIKDTEGGTDEVYSSSLTVSQMPDDFIVWEPEQPTFVHTGGVVDFNILSAGTWWSIPDFHTENFPDVSWARLIGTPTGGKGLNEPLAKDAGPVPYSLDLSGNQEGDRMVQLLVRSVDSHYPDELITIVQTGPFGGPGDITFADPDYHPAANGTLAWTNGMGYHPNAANKDVQLTMDVVVEARNIKNFYVWLEVVNLNDNSDVWIQGEKYFEEKFSAGGGTKTITLKKPYNPKFGAEGVLRIVADWEGRKDDDINTFQMVAIERHPLVAVSTAYTPYLFLSTLGNDRGTYPTLVSLQAGCNNVKIAGVATAYPNLYRYTDYTVANSISYKFPYKCSLSNTPVNLATGFTVWTDGSGQYNVASKGDFASIYLDNRFQGTYQDATRRPLCVRAPRDK